MTPGPRDRIHLIMGLSEGRRTQTNMSFFNRLTAVLLAAVLIGPLTPLEARTKKGRQAFWPRAGPHEAEEGMGRRSAAYETGARPRIPADIVYQMAADQGPLPGCADARRHRAEDPRSQGQLGEALLEFQKAYAINPARPIAAAGTAPHPGNDRAGAEAGAGDRARKPPPEQRGADPGRRGEEADTRRRSASILPVPELKPLNPDADHEPADERPVRRKCCLRPIGKVAGINVLWDPDYQSPVRKQHQRRFRQLHAGEALDYLAVITKSYWKPLSPNTIFITMDNPNKRRDYEEQVAKVFYLPTSTTPQELQEIVNAVRSVSPICSACCLTTRRTPSSRAARRTRWRSRKRSSTIWTSRKSEVVVDIMVMEASTHLHAALTAALASTGLNMPINFTPRPACRCVELRPTSTGSGTGTGTGIPVRSGTGTSTGSGTSTHSVDSALQPGQAFDGGFLDDAAERAAAG